MAEPARRIVSITLDAHLWGGESLLHDGALVGYVTSAAHSPTLAGRSGWRSSPTRGWGRWRCRWPVRGTLPRSAARRPTIPPPRE
ncbi:glycine cleavage T C-terminal barrel domain-containing protein [Nonomuraea africana]|uniref:glycine cleavage T C-terminal barrel domain-containing protein n=1 Tax=Nonomuraea africana TaxID=46171 RepID=UPI001789EB27